MNEQRINKSTVITRLVIWSVVALLLISVFVAAMIGGDNSFFLGGSILIRNETYADADSYNVGNMTYTEEIKNINIHWTDGKVNFVVREGDEIEIKESGAGEDKDHAMRSKIIGDTLDIRFVESGLYLYFTKMPEKELTVYIPPSVAMSIGKIDISSVSAEVVIGDKNKASEIAFECDKMNVECVSGDLHIFGMRANELVASAVSAQVEYTGEVKKIEVEGVSGDVSMSLANTPSKINVETVSGRINLTLPESEEGFKAELSAVSGRMRFNSKNVGYHCSHGEEKATFNFETVSGDVVIKTKKVSE